MDHSRTFQLAHVAGSAEEEVEVVVEEEEEEDPHLPTPPPLPNLPLETGGHQDSGLV